MIKEKIGVYGEWAKFYFNKGLFPLPVNSKTKAPVINSWQEYCYRVMTDAEFEKYVQSYKYLDGIGVALGPVNRIVGVDIDYMAPKHKPDHMLQADFDSFCKKVNEDRKEVIDGIVSMLPEAVCVKRGHPEKQTLFFKAGSGITSKSCKRHGITLIDILYGGRQTVMPPSIHPDGFVYKWEGEPLTGCLDKLPEINADQINAIFEKYSNQSASDKIKEISGRNDQLKKLAFSCYHQGINVDHASDLLLTFDFENHIQPLFSDPKENIRLYKTPHRAALNFAKSCYKTFKTRMTREIPKIENDPFTPFKVFFEELYPKAKKDMISGQLVYKQGSKWKSVINEIKSIKSYAISRELPYTQTESHLNRYISELPGEFVVEIPEWDEIDRIGELKDYIKIKNCDFELFADLMRWWGANVFKRLEDSKNQNICPILLGAQDIGKDYLVTKLCEGFDFYYSFLDTRKKEEDIWRQTIKRLIIHVPEFDQTGTFSVPFLKDIITREKVDHRANWKEDHEIFNCVASFISTCNNEDLFRDPTGNRRFAVFEIESILRRSYPSNWSAQVMSQFRSLADEDYQASKESRDAMNELIKKYNNDDMFEEILADWDLRVKTLCVDKRLESSRGAVPEIAYDEAVHIIREMARVYGWKPQTISSFLKRTGRKRKSNGKLMFTYGKFTNDAMN